MGQENVPHDQIFLCGTNKYKQRYNNVLIRIRKYIKYDYKYHRVRHPARRQLVWPSSVLVTTGLKGEATRVQKTRKWSYIEVITGPSKYCLSPTDNSHIYYV
jgi:hypothetical protein